MGLKDFLFGKKNDIDVNAQDGNGSDIERADEVSRDNAGIMEISNELLMEVRADVNINDSKKYSLADISCLGDAASAIVSNLGKLTKSNQLKSGEYFQLVNKAETDMLKKAKDGNFWGALKTSEGKSKMLKLKKVDGIKETSSKMEPINPTMIMMVVMMQAVNEKLAIIEEQQREIISFLENEKAAEVEADLKTLVGIVEKYKYNFSDKLFRDNNHQIVLDIQRNSEKNILFYQKQIEEEYKKNNGMIFAATVKEACGRLQKQIKYYKLTLHINAFSTLLEVMLQGNFSTDYLKMCEDKIASYRLEYDRVFEGSVKHLENMTGKSVEKNVLKGLGVATTSIGKWLGGMPFIKEGTADKKLIEAGESIKKSSSAINNKEIAGFSVLNDSGISVFISKLQDLSSINNKTSEIYCDDEYIYLLEN